MLQFIKRCDNCLLGNTYFKADDQNSVVDNKCFKLLHLSCPPLQTCGEILQGSNCSEPSLSKCRSWCSYRLVFILLWWIVTWKDSTLLVSFSSPSKTSTTPTRQSEAFAQMALMVYDCNALFYIHLRFLAHLCICLTSPPCSITFTSCGAFYSCETFYKVNKLIHIHDE